MKLKFYIGVCALSMLVLNACIDDESGEGGLRLPELSIPGSGTETMPQKNFDLGTEAVIDPQIQYDGDKSGLSYTWSVGTYANNVKGELEEISKDPVFRHQFKEGGSYYVHLIVTDGKVGGVMDYQVNINRTFENGFILISNDDAQQGNIAFVKTMTPEEIESGASQVYMEHCIERMNEGVTIGKAVNAALVTTSWPKTLTRLTVSTDKTCYFLDPNTFTILSQMEYADVFPDFNAQYYVSSSSPGPYAYDPDMGKFVHLELTYMFPYEYAYFKDSPEIDDIAMSISYYSYGMYTQDPFFMKYKPAMLSLFSQAGYFVNTKDLLEGEELVTAFFSGAQDPTTYVLNRYAITRSIENPQEAHFYELHENTPYGNPDGAYFDIVSEKTLMLTDDMAVPERGARLMPSPKYKRHFYAVDNKLYVFLIESGFTFPKKSQPAISFPDNEEITFIDVNVETEELYVATYDKVTRRGNLYIYNTADVRSDNVASPKPKAEHIGCADRIASIIYKKSISN